MTGLVTRTPQQEVIAQIRGEDFHTQLAAALPEGIPPERFARILVTALLDDQIRQTDPAKQLLSADRASLFQACLKCAQDGLLPDGRQAALVRRGKNVVYQPMVAGLRTIAAEYGWTIRSAAVRANDEFAYNDEPPELRHKVATDGDRGELVYAYAVARHKDGRREQRVMTREEVLKRMDSATTKQVWEKWPDEMWAKTSVRDLFQELPFAVAERVAVALRVAELDPGEAANALYGVEIPEGDSAAGTTGGDGPPAEPQPPTPPVAAQPSDDEPGPEPVEVSGEEADLEALAAEAAKYVPPNGKFSDGGAHGPQSLSQIYALSTGEGWFRWALGSVTAPPEYVAAVWSFARVALPEVYQAALAKRELG